MPKRLFAAVLLLSLPFLALCLSEAFGFLLFFLTLACVGFVLCRLLRMPALQSLGATVGCVSLLLAGADVYHYLAALPGAAPVEYGFQGHAGDPVLGYRLHPWSGVTRDIKALEDGTVLYDARCTLNKDGWRVTPEHPEADTAVVFLGCSYTFGQGVNDEEAFPYVVGQMLGGRYQTFNFGLEGYGPHQMLSFVESGCLDGVLRRYARVEVVFLSITSHVKRCAGYAPWDKFGPRYVWKAGGVERQGTFADAFPQRVAEVRARRDRMGWLSRKLLTSSHTWQWYAVGARDAFLFPPEGVLLRDPDLHRLQAAILAKTRDLLAAKGKGLQKDVHFTVYYYGDEDPFAAVYGNAGVPRVLVSKFFPKPVFDTPEYRIPVDRHPSPLAHSLLAKGLAGEIAQRQAVRKP